MTHTPPEAWLTCMPRRAGPHENGYVADLHRGHPAVTSGGETWIEVSKVWSVSCYHLAWHFVMMHSQSY